MFHYKAGCLDYHTIKNHTKRKIRSMKLLLASICCAGLVAGSAHAQCALSPIALSQQTLSNVAPGTAINDIFNGSQPGNFGWLTWAGSPSDPTLVNSLTVSDSQTYVNPFDANDHQLDAGDWVQGKPGVSNSKGVRDALDNLE